MDIVTLAMAKAYTDGKDVTTTITKKGVLTYDGSLDKPMIVLDEGTSRYLVQLSEDALDLSEISKMVLCTINWGTGKTEYMEFTDIPVMSDGDLTMAGELVISAKSTVTLEGFTIPKGTWGQLQAILAQNKVYNYVSEVHGVMMESKVVDPELLPEGGCGYTSESSEELVAPYTCTPSASANDAGGYNHRSSTITTTLEAGGKYLVVYDGVEYLTVATAISDNAACYLGNAALFTSGETYTGEPFYLRLSGTSAMTVHRTPTEHTFSIYKIVEVAHKIDQKYIPAMDSITLNGADGKQYAITVNESGALVATAIT